MDKDIDIITANQHFSLFSVINKYILLSVVYSGGYMYNYKHYEAQKLQSFIYMRTNQ